MEWFMATPDASRSPAGLRLDQVVAYWADRTPASPALRFGETELSWSEFEQRIRRMAAMLQGRVAQGEPAGLVCATSIDFHVLINALWRLEAPVLLLDRNWGPAIVEDLVRLVGCERLFAPPGWASAGGAAGIVEPYPEDPGEAAIVSSASGEGPKAECVALYATTSGTTDNPKCVSITHEKIRAAYDCCLNIHDLSIVRRAACLFEVNSLGTLGICFLLPREVGAATTILPSFSIANIAQSWREVGESRVDFLYLVPPLVRLLNALPRGKGWQRSDRLLAFCSSAPVGEHELRRLEETYPLQTYNIYGLTELTFAVFFGARGADGLASETIGRALGIEARLLDADGALIEGPGKGELHIGGPMLTDGYLHNPAATSASFDHGWLATGDIAERDGEGLYYIRGRLKDVVLRGGYTYYLAELEHYLRRAPEVIDVCAFRGRDLPSGDELCALVQTKGPADPAMLMQWIRESMGASKLPNMLYASPDALPRNSNGKIDRNQLRRLHLEGALEGEVA